MTKKTPTSEPTNDERLNATVDVIVAEADEAGKEMAKANDLSWPGVSTLFRYNVARLYQNEIQRMFQAKLKG